MSDVINAKGAASQFKVHEEGQYIAVCCDVVDLGEKPETFANESPKLAHKCVLIFRTGERNEATGEYIDVNREFTVSMGEKANLRKFLEQWRGKPYSIEQVEAGVPLHKLTGQPALLTIAHKISGKGNAYANIAACVGVPKQMQGGISQYPDYKRDEYWTKKRAEYAEATRKFKAQNAPSGGEDFDDFPTDAEETNDTSLPF